MEVVKLILLVILLLITLLMMFSVVSLQMKAYGENKLAGVMTLLYWSLFTYCFVSLFKMFASGWL